MATPATPAVPIAKSYAELRRNVEAAYFTGKRQADEAATFAAWIIGRMMDEHILLFKERADYGAKTVRRLARESTISSRVLYRCLAFGKAYQIVPKSAQLTCAHFMALASKTATPNAWTPPRRRIGFLETKPDGRKRLKRHKRQSVPEPFVAIRLAAAA